ncbi:hypothetical protein BJY00DRAFT_317743 [Aspergillus carlsbadensis]|nr:hypothetical protein BJY00DRAFT_317743 [Aspergillus carlsbadensis]
MAHALGTVSNGFEITPEGYIKAATGTVVKVVTFPVFFTVRPDDSGIANARVLKWQEFKPEPCPVPKLGQQAVGYWLRDGVVWWTKGTVDRVDGCSIVYIVEKGLAETYTARDPMNGTKPALGFR